MLPYLEIVLTSGGLFGDGAVVSCFFSCFFFSSYRWLFFCVSVIRFVFAARFVRACAWFSFLFWFLFCFVSVRSPSSPETTSDRDCDPSVINAYTVPFSMSASCGTNNHVISHPSTTPRFSLQYFSALLCKEERNVLRGKR